MTPIRIALVDDHALLKAGLKEIIMNQSGMDVRVVASNGKELLEKISRNKVDVVIAGEQLSDLSVTELAHTISRDFKETHLIILTQQEENINIRQVLASGAKGHILISAKPEELMEAIVNVSQGKSFYCRGTYELLARELEQNQLNRSNALSEREMNVIWLLYDEYTEAEIAKTMGVTLKTVSNIRKEIFRKSGTNSMVSLIKWVVRNNLFRKVK